LVSQSLCDPLEGAIKIRYKIVYYRIYIRRIKKKGGRARTENPRGEKGGWYGALACRDLHRICTLLPRQRFTPYRTRL
jgi:hypothetical protein